MSDNRRFWGDALASASEVASLHATAPALLSAAVSQSIPPYSGAGLSFTATPSVTRPTSAPSQSQTAYLRQWHPHTAWDGTTPAAAAIRNTTRPPPSPPRDSQTPLYGDTSSRSSPTADSTSSATYSYTYSSYYYYDDDGDEEAEDGIHINRTISVDASTSSTSSLSPSPADDEPHRAPRLAAVVAGQSARTQTPTVLTEPGVVMAIASPAAAPPRQTADSGAVPLPTNDDEAATHTAAVTGFLVARPRGIQVLTVRHASAGSTEGVRERAGPAVTAPPPAPRTAASPPRLAGTCLGRLPGAAASATAVVPARKTVSTHCEAQRERVEETEANRRTHDQDRPLVLCAPSSSSSASSSSAGSASCAAPARRRVVLGGDPLAYQPPRVPLRPHAAEWAASEHTSDCDCACHAWHSDHNSSHSHSSHANASSSALSTCHCSCCSACSSRHGHHADGGADAFHRSACTSVSDVWRPVSHEARRTQAAVDPFATLGPAAPPLLRLGVPRQTAAPGTLRSPVRDGAPVPLPPLHRLSGDHNHDDTETTGRYDDDDDATTGLETHAHVSCQEASTQTNAGEAQHVSVGTQVEEWTDGPEASDWKALMAAQTTALQSEWQAWAWQTAQAHDAQRKAVETAEAERQKKPDVVDSGSSPHETHEATALAFVRAAAADDSAQALHAVLATLYHETIDARDAAMYQRTELSAAVERERQTAERLEAMCQNMHNLLDEQFISLEVEEAAQRLRLMDLETDTRLSILAPVHQHVLAMQATYHAQLEAAQHWFTQQRLAGVYAERLHRDVVDAETHARQTIATEEQTQRFTGLVPNFYAARQTLLLAETTDQVAQLTAQVTTLTTEKARAAQQYRQLQQQDVERRAALGEALRRPTVTLHSEGRPPGSEGLSRTARAANGAGEEEEEEDLPIHRRFARAHQEALKAVRAQQRRV